MKIKEWFYIGIKDIMQHSPRHTLASSEILNDNSRLIIWPDFGNLYKEKAKVIALMADHGNLYKDSFMKQLQMREISATVKKLSKKIKELMKRMVLLVQ